MKRKLTFRIQIIITLIFVVMYNVSLSQTRNVYMNWDYKDARKDTVFNLWKQYLTYSDSSNILWSKADIARFKGVDILKDGNGFSGYFYKVQFNCNVIAISEVGENYLIRTALYWPEKDSQIVDKFILFAIIDVMAVKENGTYKLSNYINYSTADWLSKRVGCIVYHYPSLYPFDIFKAKSAIAFIDSMQNWFAFKTDTLNYYIAPNCTEIRKITGLEYFEGEGNELNLCGYYDEKNNIVYSNFIMGECYKHELTHLINKSFPSANSYLLTGLSAYIDDAGQFGKSEKFHIKRYQHYLNTHPSDLNKFYEISYIDDVTAPQYIFGAVICNALLKKGGLSLLKKAMVNTKKDEQFVDFLKKNLNIKDFNKFFAKEFNAYLVQKDVLLRTTNE